MGQMEPGKGQGIELAVGAWLTRAQNIARTSCPNKIHDQISRRDALQRVHVISGSE
jgi:hypothetical protein